MKRLMLLAFVPLLLAADAVPWPQKGDTVYVAATLTAVVQGSTVYGGPPTTSTVRACLPMTFVTVRPADKYSSDGVSWELQAAPVLSVGLSGSGWKDRLHRTEADCHADVEKRGEPTTIIAGGRNTIR